MLQSLRGNLYQDHWVGGGGGWCLDLALFALPLFGVPNFFFLSVVVGFNVCL